jgi:PAS domain S-box-containing protein
LPRPPVLESSALAGSPVSRKLHWFATRAEQAIFVGGADGRVEWANEAACRLCGASLEELVGRRVQLFPDDADAEREAAEHIGRRIAAGERVRLEAALRGREGRALWIDLEVTPVPADRDAPGGWVAVALDVTERKRAEAAVAESEERYRSLVEGSPEPVAVHSEGRLVYANPAALALLGASSNDQVLGRPVFDFVHPDYHALAAERILKMELVGDPAELVVERLLRVDGSPVDVELAATPITWRGAPAIQLAGRAVGARAGRAVGARAGHAVGARAVDARVDRAGGDRNAPGEADATREAPAPRGPVLDLSSLVLELAPCIEGRLAPRAVVSFDLTGALLAFPGEAGALAALLRAVVGQAAAALPGGRGALLVRTDVCELDRDEAARFSPPDALGRGPYLFVEAFAEGGRLATGAGDALYDADFAERFPESGPGLAGALALARAHGGALRVQSGPDGGLQISVALPRASSARGGRARPAARRRTELRARSRTR